MKSIRPHFVSLLILLGIGCTSYESSIQEEGNVEVFIERVENSLYGPVIFAGDELWNIEDRMKHYGVPGLSIAVIKDNKIQWAKSYGIMDKDSREPVTNTTLFQAGSISKPVAAYGALKLVQEAKINLDENVNTYLTSWKLPENEFTQEESVALKHLLSHTGGVTVHGFLGYSPDLEVPSLVQVFNGDGPANSPPIRVDKVPEESFRYSGGGYCIMQQMLIDIEGSSFPGVLEAKVLSSLEMTRSTYDQPLNSEMIKTAATGYLPNGDMTKGKRHTYPEMAAAGLWTTAEDLAKFAIDVSMTYNGERESVLTQAMVERMLTPFVEDFIGMGIFLDEKRGTTYFGHGGWDEGFSSELVASRDNGYGVVVLTNSNHPPMISELIRSVAHVYEWEGYLPPVYKNLGIDESARIAGRYKYSADDVIQIFTEGQKTFFKFLRDEPMELFRVGDNRFVRRERETPILLVTNQDDNQDYLFFEQNEGDEPEFNIPRINDDEKVPFEWLLEGSYENALSAYKALKERDPADDAISENRINQTGYQFMGKGDVKMAINVFKINVALYPEAFNTYDSLGEAYMENGDTELAMENYRKSLELNSENTNAVEMLEKMEQEQV